MAMDETGLGVTLTVPDPLAPLRIALIVADPVEIPVTSPEEFTVATVAFEDVQLACEDTFAVDVSL